MFEALKSSLLGGDPPKDPAHAEHQAKLAAMLDDDVPIQEASPGDLEGASLEGAFFRHCSGRPGYGHPDTRRKGWNDRHRQA